MNADYADQIWLWCLFVSCFVNFVINVLKDLTTKSHEKEHERN